MAPRNRRGGTAAPSPQRGDTVGAVRHAIDLLRCLSGASAPVGVNEVARRIGLHKSSVSRIARTLEDQRLLQRDPVTGQLSPGIGLLALAAPVLAGFEMRELARPLLEALARESGETASLNIWDGSEAVSIEQVPGSNSVRAFSRPGHRDPGHATASGKILLAHLGRAAIAAYCNRPLRRFTEHTITDPASLMSALAACRDQGYAINVGELDCDIGAVSAAVFGRDSSILAAITAAVPMYRFKPGRRSELAASVLNCAAELSAKLGYRRPAAGAPKNPDGRRAPHRDQAGASRRGSRPKRAAPGA